MAQPLPNPMVGIQVSPITFLDEGVEPLLDLLQGRFGINTLMVGTVSWMALKVGRSVAAGLDGWPDHGVGAPYPLRGGGYLAHRKNYYRCTLIDDFRTKDEAFAGKDILDLVIKPARARGMRRDRIGEVARRGAPDCFESEGMRRVDGRRDDTILERQRGMGDRIVLHPAARHAKLGREARRVDERREAGIERMDRRTGERQPFPVAPDRLRPSSDLRARREPPARVENRIERP